VCATHRSVREQPLQLHQLIIVLLVWRARERLDIHAFMRAINRRGWR